MLVEASLRAVARDQALAVQARAEPRTRAAARPEERPPLEVRAEAAVFPPEEAATWEDRTRAARRP